MQHVTKIQIVGLLKEDDMDKVYAWWLETTDCSTKEELEEDDYQIEYVVVGETRLPRYL
jgi:hypothetical protein